MTAPGERHLSFGKVRRVHLAIDDLFLVNLGGAA